MTNDKNKLMSGPANHPFASEYIWTKVISVVTDGTTVADSGLGPIVLSDIIPILLIRHKHMTLHLYYKK